MGASLKHIEKSDYLIEKGLKILWCKGYNGTSVSDIVNAAEVPKGSFYFYFDSKEDYVVKVLEKYFENKRGTIIKDIFKDTDVSPKQSIYNFYNLRVKYIKEQLNCKLGCMGSNMGTEMAEHSEKIRTTIVAEERKIRLQVRDVVKKAQDAKEITNPIEADKIVDFVEDSFKGMLTSMKETKSSEPLDNFLKFLAVILN
ncbi:TetR/AcrR family transcriptional regulator [Maribacter litoralis]|uniref:TetR/AcrR family transcriptional regulator n=1 Tax=Maribacter litoralis TaxID=2059726 RepID=UPI003F5CF89F